MADPFIESHIRRLPLFERLTPDQIELVADAIQVLRFQPGELVFRQSQPTQGLFLFVEGRGILTQAAANSVEREIATVNDEEYLDEAALFVQMTEVATLKVVEPAIVLFFSRAALATLLSHHPEIKANLHVSYLDYRDLTEGAFPGQRENEAILLMTRRHPWAWMRFLWLPFLLMVGMLLFALTIAHVPPLALAVAGLAVVLPGLLAIYLYLEWYNDQVIVTDQRILRIDRNLLKFQSTVNELPLERVHQVNAEVPATDPFARVLNYGTVVIKPAGEAGSMILKFIPNPQAMQSLIFNNRNLYRERSGLQDRSAIRAEIERYLGRTGDSAATLPVAPSMSRPQPQQGLNLVQVQFVNENGDTVYRKHGLVWLQHVAFPALLFLAGMIVFGITLLGGLQQGILGLTLSFFLMVIGALWFYAADWDWRNDLYIVSDERITFISKRPLWLQNEVDQALLSQVDNVVSVVQGPINNLFNLGDVRIFMIGSDRGEQKVFESVYQPDEVRAEISRRQLRARAREQEVMTQQQREAIAEYLSVYHEVTGQQNPGAPQPLPPAQDNTDAAPPAEATAYSEPSPEDTLPNEPPPTPLRDNTRPPNVPRRSPPRPDDLPE